MIRLEAFRTPDAAVRELLAPFQRAVSCVTPEVLIREPGTARPPRAIGFREGAVRLRGRQHLELPVLVEYAVDPGELRRSYRARLTGYKHEIGHVDGPMILAYHWHPVGVSPVTTPHLHLGGSVASVDLSRAHLPTGFVALQDVVRFAIIDLGVAPLRDDWREVLAA